MVWFVGAGPGDVDLITCKGRKLIEEADIVIYAGSLVNPEHLKFTKKEAEIYNSAYMDLDEIISIMIKAWKDNKNIVRLHTGDPSIYGAIKEQMDLLKENNIPYNICPGVSSFCGAAASLKAEYTLPNISQSVILTRRAGRTPVRKEESIEKLASHTATMIIFLSASMAFEVSKELMRGGYRGDTKAAIVYKATWNDEKIIRCTVKDIGEAARRNNITKTALLIVGDSIEGENYNMSCLYDKNFETEFRKCKK